MSEYERPSGLSSLKPSRNTLPSIATILPPAIMCSRSKEAFFSLSAKMLVSPSGVLKNGNGGSVAVLTGTLAGSNSVFAGTAVATGAATVAGTAGAATLAATAGVGVVAGDGVCVSAGGTSAGLLQAANTSSAGSSRMWGRTRMINLRKWWRCDDVAGDGEIRRQRPCNPNPGERQALSPDRRSMRCGGVRLLFGNAFCQPRVRRVGIGAAGVGIDERIALPVLATLRLIFEQVRGIRMRGHQHVAGKRAHDSDAMAELRDACAAIGGEAKAGCGYRAEAVGENEIVADLARAIAPAPAGAARRVSRRVMCGQADSSQRDDFTIGDFRNVGNAREIRDIAQNELRVVGAGAAGAQRLRTEFAGRDFRATHALQRRDASGVIEMRMRVDNPFHILDAKAELADVVGDPRRRLQQVAIDQHQARLVSDQHRADALD